MHFARTLMVSEEVVVFVPLLYEALKRLLKGFFISQPTLSS